MLCVPWVRLLVLHVAILELAAPAGSAIALQPVIVVPPSVKATGPVGAVPATVAVNVTLAPTSDGLPELDSVVLVGHDWGGALAFDWAARHPESTRGVAFMEAIIRPLSWDEFPALARPRYEALRTPGVGEKLALEENVVLASMNTLTPLSDADMEAYRRPYPTPESRRPLLEWTRSIRSKASRSRPA